MMIPQDFPKVCNKCDINFNVSLPYFLIKYQKQTYKRTVCLELFPM